MVDKFWNFFRGSAARWRARGRTRRAGRTALPGRPRSRSRPSAVHATCALVRRARRRGGGPILVRVVPRCGMRGSCAGTEVSDARGRSVRMHGRPDQALHPLRARAPARTRQHALAMPMAFREGLTRCAAACRSPPPRSTLSLAVILALPSRLHPPWPHPHPRPHRPMARAVGPRLTRCPTLALAPGGWRPCDRGRSTRRVLPRVVAARPHAGSALRRVTPATRRLRGPRAGTERESVDATTTCVGPRRSAAHARPRTRPTRTLRCGRCQDALCCAVWQVRAAWRRGGRSWGAAARAAWTSSVLLQCAAHIASESCLRGSLARWRALWSDPTVEVFWRKFAETAAHSLGVPPAA